MIIRFKIQAFVALLTVSILVAVAAQIPLKDVFTVVSNGVGSTMGKVALLIALGAILGRMIEVSGGVQSLADHFTAKLGAKRVAVALTAVGFLVAIPVFFEVGIIVLVPIVYAFSKIANVHPVKFGLPMAGIMLAIHVAVPPHPGIVAGAGVFGADIGLIALISLTHLRAARLPVLLGRSIMNRKDYELLPAVKAQVDEFGSASLVHVGHDGPGAQAVAPPRPGLIIFLIAAPIVQILLGTVGTLTISKDSAWYGVAAFVGNPFFALLVAVALSFFLLAVRRQWSLKETGEIFEGALPPIASILMVVAAGGVFGGVLRPPASARHSPKPLTPGPAAASCSPSSSPSPSAPPRVRPRWPSSPPLACSPRPSAEGGYTPGPDRRARHRHRLRFPGPLPRDRRRLLDGGALLRTHRRPTASGPGPSSPPSWAWPASP